MILGLDPGTRIAGYGVLSVLGAGGSGGSGGELRVVESGVIEMNESWPLARRLDVLASGLAAVYSRNKIVHTVVEKIFFGKNADSAFKLGHARGVCLMMAARHSTEVHEYAARFVKKCVTGSGAASKDHVQLVIRAVLNLRDGARMAVDASDALALALTHVRESENAARVREALRRAGEKGI